MKTLKKLFVLISVGGYGFHYDVLMVPVECTAESLGIRLIEIGD